MCARAHQLAARLLNICFAKALWTPVLLQLQLYVDKEKPMGIHASRAKSLQVTNRLISCTYFALMYDLTYACSTGLAFLAGPGGMV